MKVYKYIVLVASLAATIFLGICITKIGQQDRSVTVRGLSEREVDADLAIWPVKYKVASNDLSTLQNEIVTKNQALEKYLNSYGLDSSDYTIQASSITDVSMNMYLDKDKQTYKYLADQTFLVRSNKVQNVKNAQKDSLQLLKSGIALNNNYYESQITFEFTKLNEIKPEMIAEATQNARLAAEQFAHDSHSKVGKIKNATQGLFTIENAAQGLEDKKTIRVVTSVEYLLK